MSVDVFMTATGKKHYAKSEHAELCHNSPSDHRFEIDDDEANTLLSEVRLGDAPLSGPLICQCTVYLPNRVVALHRIAAASISPAMPGLLAIAGIANYGQKAAMGLPRRNRQR